MKNKLSLQLDWSIVFIPAIFAAASLATLYSITSVSGKTDLVLNQAVYYLIGIILYVVAAIFDYKELKRYSLYLYFFVIASLIFVDLFGQTMFGSRRWIDLGGFFRFQPSEITKLSLIIISAGYFSKNLPANLKKILIYLPFLLVPALLVFTEPDLGTTLCLLIIGISAILSSKISKKLLIAFLVVFVVSIPVSWKIMKPYQRSRVVSVVNPESDPLGSGYNVNQSKIAVGSGGLVGKGFGGATQSQLQFLPVAHIDFIFSGWAEATGFIGSLVIITCYSFLVFRIFQIGMYSKDAFGSLFCIATSSLIFFQAFVNIGMNIGIVPATGIPLPFLSYGGTSILTNSLLVGIVQSVYMRRKVLKFD